MIHVVKSRSPGTRSIGLILGPMFITATAREHKGTAIMFSVGLLIWEISLEFKQWRLPKTIESSP